jgi:sarcosine oxidase, subunit gamma
MPEPALKRLPPPLTLKGVLEPLPPATRWVLRGAEPVRAAAEGAFGAPIPSLACRAASAGARAALWMGPDEWLLRAGESEAAMVGAALDAALGGLPHSLVDVSHRQIACSVSGPAAVALLSSGCPLDLDLRAFPVDMCTRTMLAKAEVVLWRTGAEAFHLEVWRSFAAYVSLFIAEAARGMKLGEPGMSQGAKS